ncbi:hypothetical protein BJ875DRAFT_125038 [Amylocarpus encephaloides]|uniref:Uncharacterized protein n=1 Tax=Amylocarpus encephaloides TaxID=45428 RepID=A0A9P7YQB1_9HELO|nr:hypothetical protein BJ875DRAFT_125038 [Amylocarpus encephaloides]
MMNTRNWDRTSLGYSTVESLLEDVSKQMGRFSRASNTPSQRTSGSTRVAKPNSASNSPRGVERRRTVMADYGPYRRRVAVPSFTAGFVSNDGLPLPNRSSRPVSWHPSTQQIPHAQPQSFYQPPTYDFNSTQFQSLSSTPAFYSEYTSPTTDFTHIPQSHSGFEQPQYPILDAPSHYSVSSQQAFMIEDQAQHHAASGAGLDTTIYPNFEWSNMAPSNNSFESSTAPPTPEYFLPIQVPGPIVPSEESITYQSLGDDEEDEDLLVGVGLYDMPESTPDKPMDLDPGLGFSRSATWMMRTQFLSAEYGGRRMPQEQEREREAPGKGLKLEEGWAPPMDDGKHDEEADGEGEDEDEDEEETSTGPAPRPQQQQQQQQQQHQQQRQYDPTGNWV